MFLCAATSRTTSAQFVDSSRVDAIALTLASRAVPIRPWLETIRPTHFGMLQYEEAHLGSLQVETGSALTRLETALDSLRVHPRLAKLELARSAARQLSENLEGLRDLLARCTCTRGSEKRFEHLRMLGQHNRGVRESLRDLDRTMFIALLLVDLVAERSR